MYISVSNSSETVCSHRSLCTPSRTALFIARSIEQFATSFWTHSITDHELSLFCEAITVTFKLYYLTLSNKGKGDSED